MNASDRLVRVAPYVGRLLEDETVQEQLAQAFSGLRRSSEIAKRQGAAAAVNDRRLHRQLGDAVRSLSRAGQSLAAPPPKRRRGRRALLLAAAAGASVILARRRQP